MRISEYLETGKRNAKPAKLIARHFGISTREVSKEIEQERKEGKPICASTGKPSGYYLAANAAELKAFCNQLHGRASEIYGTRRALMKILDSMERGEYRRM